MRRLTIISFAALGVFACAFSAGAQALGPQRQFLALEPYYERTNLDVGEGAAREGINGYGGRLWINLDPFHFIPKSSIALYLSHTPSQGAATASFNGVKALHYGAEYNQFLVRRPLGGFIDPFLAVGGGRIQFKDALSKESYWTLTPGGGIRVPIPNRFELRGDVKDLILFNRPFQSGIGSTERTTHNLLLQAGLGLTF